MSKTQNLTLGAMFLAIIGAFVLLNMSLGSIIADTLPFMVVPMLVYYKYKTSKIETLFLSIGMLAISLVSGNIFTIIQIVLAIIVGNIVNLVPIQKPKRLFIIMTLAYALGEVLIAFVISPILGISLIEQTRHYTEIFQNISYSFIIALFTTSVLAVAIIESTISFVLIAKLLSIKK